MGIEEPEQNALIARYKRHLNETIRDAYTGELANAWFLRDGSTLGKDWSFEDFIQLNATLAKCFATPQLKNRASLECRRFHLSCNGTIFKTDDLELNQLLKKVSVKNQTYSKLNQAMQRESGIAPSLMMVDSKTVGKEAIQENGANVVPVVGRGAELPVRNSMGMGK